MILKLSTITSLVNYGAVVVLAWQYHEKLHEGFYIQVIVYYMQIYLRCINFKGVYLCNKLW